MNPCVSYEWMLSHGYLDDIVHPGNVCYSNLAGVVCSELGLFALRVDHRLAIESWGDGWGTRIT